MILRLQIFIILLLACSLTKAQELPSSTQQQLENWAELNEDEMGDDQLLQQLTGYKNKPLDINEAGREDLEMFPFLSALQVQNFLNYRAALGKLLSIYELQAIPGWDVVTIRKLLPFIIVKQQGSLPVTILSRLKKGEHMILLRTSRVLEKAEGYDPSATNHFLGSPDYWQMRYRYKFNNLLQYGFTAEKDAGEQLFKGSQRTGFDSYSAHFFARNLGFVKAIALGDFSVSLGQGLVQWQSLAFSKGNEVTSVKKQGAVLKPYTSAGEMNFNRGLGVTVRQGKMEATLFSSFHPIDANTAIDSMGHEQITSFNNSGLHRTAAEIEKRRNVELFSFGGNISWRIRSFYLGLNGVAHSFSEKILKRAEPYNLYAIKGNNFSNASMDYSFTYKNIHVFGEFANDQHFNKAILNGLIASLDSKVDLSLLHRYYGKAYTTIYGKAFSENTLPSNESGFYLGLRLQLREDLVLNAYSDFYKFPWLKYRTDAPSEGREYFLQLNYQPNKQVELYGRYKNESKMTNVPDETSAMNKVDPKIRQNLRVHFSYIFSRRFTWQNRMDVVWYDKGGNSEEEGFLFYTDGSFSPTNKLSVHGRATVFETSGFNSRIYTYENDVLYAFSTPFYNGNGFRYYILFNYDLTKRISTWIRFSNTTYKDQLGVGSGSDKIDSNNKSDLRLQVMLKF